MRFSKVVMMLVLLVCNGALAQVGPDAGVVAETPDVVVAPADDVVAPVAEDVTPTVTLDVVEDAAPKADEDVVAGDAALDTVQAVEDVVAALEVAEDAGSVDVDVLLPVAEDVSSASTDGDAGSVPLVIPETGTPAPVEPVVVPVPVATVSAVEWSLAEWVTWMSGGLAILLGCGMLLKKHWDSKPKFPPTPPPPAEPS